MSQNPAIAIGKLRPHTQRLWQRLSTDDKRDFLRNDAASWNVIRHRIPVAIHNKITDALDSGRLRIVAGTIEQLIPNEQSIDVVLTTSDGSNVTQPGDLVVNCTGPQLHFSETPLPLFKNLLRKGLVQCDDLEMGIEVDDDFAVVSDEGGSMRRMYAIGPLLRGKLWESTAVPELRVQAMRVAESLLEREPSDVAQEELIEYYI